MMHSSDEDIELCSIDRFSSVRLNRTFYEKTQKKSKISRRVCRDKIELVQLSSLRFGSKI